jgi:hypothetical protein
MKEVLYKFTLQYMYSCKTKVMQIPCVSQEEEEEEEVHMNLI